MLKQPLVSIITPFLNSEKFLQEAIESIICQTYDNWELLLINDGSTDDSLAIALRYVERYPKKIYYLEHKKHQHRGKSTSRNLGIEHSQGKYIGFLDADDVYLPEKLSKQVNILELNPDIGMVYGATKYWYSWKGNSENHQKDLIRELGVKTNTLYKPPQLLIQYLKNPSLVPCICGFIASSNLIKKLGGFDESIQYLYEDQTLLSKIILHSSVFVDKNYYELYRQHPDSSWNMALQTGEASTARRIYLEWLEKYLINQSVKNPELWKLLLKMLWKYQYPDLYDFTRKVNSKLKSIISQASHI
jgi:glycosyltransferase involved in cell wall biosynthesis